MTAWRPCWGRKTSLCPRIPETVPETAPGPETPCFICTQQEQLGSHAVGLGANTCSPYSRETVSATTIAKQGKEFWKNVPILLQQERTWCFYYKIADLTISIAVLCFIVFKKTKSKNKNKITNPLLFKDRTAEGAKPPRGRAPRPTELSCVTLIPPWWELYSSVNGQGTSRHFECCVFHPHW